MEGEEGYTPSAYVMNDEYRMVMKVIATTLLVVMTRLKPANRSDPIK
ncbi:hypothetical protein MLD52_19325 [Puniceicoccaceae bacterium K14]|nr:hypothetical protein [Puniceicoccaceae bacterium K14]